jgi:sulfatase modifying factor 1
VSRGRSDGRMPWIAAVHLHFQALAALAVCAVLLDGCGPRRATTLPPPKPADAEADAEARDAEAPRRRARAVDDAPLPEMVELPAVELARGDVEAGAPVLPRETVERFFLDTTEVSAEAYEGCVRAGACAAAKRAPGCTGGDARRAQHPINCVRWADADAYCRSVGKRLPTEAEWERAARGPEGRRFVWVGDFPPPALTANLADSSAGRARPYWNVIPGYDDGVVETAPVDAFRGGDRTPEGVVQLAGNVAEWVADAWDADLAKRTPTQRAQLATQKGAKLRVVRGASFGEDRPLELRAARRQGLDAKAQSVHVGFRCARSTPPAAVDAPARPR